jgi:hypothetical protein
MYSVAGYMARKRGFAAPYCFSLVGLDPESQSKKDPEAECHTAHRQLVQNPDETRQDADETRAGKQKAA